MRLKLTDSVISFFFFLHAGASFGAGMAPISFMSGDRARMASLSVSGDSFALTSITIYIKTCCAAM